eukprot:scaffold122696_cov48-Phaeocystis_antarctica.AAC.2
MAMAMARGRGRGRVRVGRAHGRQVEVVDDDVAARREAPEDVKVKEKSQDVTEKQGFGRACQPEHTCQWAEAGRGWRPP